MYSPAQTRVLPLFLGVSALVLSACAPQPVHKHRLKTNHFGPSFAPGGYYQPAPRALRRAPFLPQFQQWVEYEPEYQLYPGDQVDVVVSTAPELSRTLTVGPDGRIVMPMAKPVMAAGRTFEQVEKSLMAELGTQLRDPTLAITPRAYAPQQIFVGGEVNAQGTYTLPGPIGATEAILMAGGLRPTAKTSQVAVLRRAPNGGMMLRTVRIDHRRTHYAPNNDILQLRRGDIIFVPRTDLAEVANWMQTFRSALPVDFNLSYQFGTNGGGTTVISP